jgi:hypothetical protein
MPQKSFNIVGLVVALLLVMVIAAILIPAIDASRHRETRIVRSSQLRGIHQGLVTHANSNQTYFVGLNPDGTTNDTTVEYRFQTLIEEDYFTPEYVISPAETEAMMAWEDQEKPITKDNYSYAMLQIPETDSGRRDEWKQTINSQAIVVSDRNTGSIYRPRSVHYEPGDKFWSGSVLWNDNHVEFKESGSIFETKYGSGKANLSDGLFLAETPDDALLIHSGN